MRRYKRWRAVKDELWICNNSELCNGFFTTEDTEGIEGASHRLARTHNLDMDALSPYHQFHHSLARLKMNYPAIMARI